MLLWDIRCVGLHTVNCKRIIEESMTRDWEIVDCLSDCLATLSLSSLKWVLLFHLLDDIVEQYKCVCERRAFIKYVSNYLRASSINGAIYSTENSSASKVATIMLYLTPEPGLTLNRTWWLVDKQITRALGTLLENIIDSQNHFGRKQIW